MACFCYFSNSQEISYCRFNVIFMSVDILLLLCIFLFPKQGYSLGAPESCFQCFVIQPSVAYNNYMKATIENLLPARQLASYC